MSLRALTPVPITSLPSATTPLAGSEAVAVVQGGTTKQVSVTNLTAGRSVSAADLTASTGNLTFSNTAQRITGDMSNATIANRLMFQTSTANGASVVSAIPNGTGTITQFAAYGGSDPANAQVFRLDNRGGTESRIESTYAGTPASGTYLPMTFYTGGSERVRVDTSGRMGVGTNTPAVTLQATNTSGEVFRLTNTTASERLHFYTRNAAGTSRVESQNSDLQLFAADANPLTLGTSNTERMRIDASGNVGIGTASPGVKLDVLAADNTTTTVRNGAYAANAISTTTVFESFGCRNDGNNSFGGRFGAAYRRADGTAIASSASLGYYAFGGQWGTDTTYQSAKLLYAASIVGVAEGSFTSASAMPTGIVFRTGSTGDALASVNLSYGTERMRITSTGNIVAGASAALATTATDGFLYVPTCAGQPTGTPTAITGMAPIVVDTTNNKLYFYSTGVWRDAGP